MNTGHITKDEVINWYGTLTSDKRMELQDKFNKYGTPDRESKFYKWLKGIKKQEDYIQKQIQQKLKENGY